MLVAIDRRGNFYCGSEGGAFRNEGGRCDITKDKTAKWEPFFVRRVETRRVPGRIIDRVPHDYQRINIDFGLNTVAFGSDQGMFIRNWTNASELQLYSADGDVNNNIIMHPAVSKAEGNDGERCIVTALWDWSPVASWDSGKHWPSWQTEDDGAGMGYFGEGGGCFGVGESTNVLCMHHHNVAFSSRCGKNMSRFVAPNGASVGPPEFMRTPTSRSVPAGPVFALMTMYDPPFDNFTDKTLTCSAVPGSEQLGDLGVHPTKDRCLSHLDIGLEYGWFQGVNVAVWRGGTDKHCILCKVTGNSTSWPFQDAAGDIVYALSPKAEVGKVKEMLQSEAEGNGNVDDDRDDSGDGDDDDDDAHDDAMHAFARYVEKARNLEVGHDEERPSTGFHEVTWGEKKEQVGVGGYPPKHVLMSWNFGANWTWIKLPDALQGIGQLRADPTNGTGILYGISRNCIYRSFDQAQTWMDECWGSNAGVEGSLKDLVIKVGPCTSDANLKVY